MAHKHCFYLPFAPLYACIESLLYRSNDEQQCWLSSTLYIGVLVNDPIYIFYPVYMTITDMLISCKALQCFAPHQLCQQVHIGKKKSQYSNNSSIMFVLILSRIQIHTYLFSQRRLVTLPMFIVQGGCKEMLWLKIRQSKLVSDLEGFPLTDGIHVF